MFILLIVESQMLYFHHNYRKGCIIDMIE